jgi:hypothetical protein
MPVEEFEVLRRQMLAEISAATAHATDLIGKAALDERVMTAMGKVPRHEFVPIELQGSLILAQPVQCLLGGFAAVAHGSPPGWTPAGDNGGGEARSVS